MKRHLLFLISSVALGALSGFVISDLAKVSPGLPAPAASALPYKADDRAAAPVTRPAPTATALDRLIGATVAAVSPAKAAKPLPKGGLVLSEPVVIVAGGQGQAVLPQGTAVSLVKNEGRFVSVRHERTVVTVPRSALTVAMARTN